MVVPLLMRTVGSRALARRQPKLPFRRLPGDLGVDLTQTVLESLAFLDIESLFHPYALLKCGTPCEYAYHFQLYDLLQHRVSEGGWRVLGESRNALIQGPPRRLDILIASNGCRSGIELLVDGVKLDSHVSEQAPAYMLQQKLHNVLVVNFATQQACIVGRLPTVPPAGVELLQVLVDREAGKLVPYKLGGADGCTAEALAAVAVASGSDTAATHDLVDMLVVPMAAANMVSQPPAQEQETTVVVAGSCIVPIAAVGSVQELLEIFEDQLALPAGALEVISTADGGRELTVPRRLKALNLLRLARRPRERLELRRVDRTASPDAEPSAAAGPWPLYLE